MLPSHAKHRVGADRVDKDKDSVEQVEMEGMPIEPPRKRSRTTAACDRCTARHIKCDGAVQCSFCSKNRVECMYSKKGKRGPKKKFLLLNAVGASNPKASERIYNRGVFMELAAAFQVHVNEVFATVPSPNQLELDGTSQEEKFVLAVVAANGMLFCIHVL